MPQDKILWTQEVPRVFPWINVFDTNWSWLEVLSLEKTLFSNEIGRSKEIFPCVNKQQ